MSCGSPTFCIALDATGRAYRFDGPGWTGPVPATGQPIGPGSISVSCSNPTFCMAVATAGSEVTSWNGSGWSGPMALDGANGLEAVGCAPSGYCAAVDAEGNAFAFSGNAWTGTSGDWGSVSAISCVTPSFCMSTSGGISQWNGEQWTMPNSFGDSSSFAGRLLPDDDVLHGGGRLGRGAPVERSHLVGTSHASNPDRPRRPRSDPHRRASPAPRPPSARRPTVRGASSSGPAGHWTRVDVDGNRHLTSISCPSASFCAAVDQSGRAIVGKP